MKRKFNDKDESDEWRDIINMTPHDINLILDEEKKIVRFPSAGVVRLKAETKRVGACGRFPLSKTVFGKPEGLPEFKPGTLLIVSQLVKTALPERKDLVVPAEVVRDKDGKIIGCKSFGL